MAGIIEILRFFNYKSRRKLFRREVEAIYYSNKQIKLPAVGKVSRSSLDYFKLHYPLNYFQNQKEFDTIANTLLKLEDESEIISAAEKIIENKYNVFNNGELFLGDTINWHFDYHSGFQFPKSLSWREDFFNLPEGVDISFPWEIARFKQGVTLGKAYLITGDEKYTDKFIYLLEDFNSANPFCFGVNWLDASEAAVRLLNILFSLSFFILSKKIDENFLNKFNKIILSHSIFIENNLEYARYKDHKYTISLLALAAAGLIFKDTAYGKKNLHFCQTGFEQEIRNQLYKDGVCYVQSVPLHFIILETFYLGQFILNKAGLFLSETFKDRLYKLFAVSTDYIRDDFSVPAIGDSAPGRIIPFNLQDREINYNYPLSVGAYLFKDKLNYYKTIKPSAELLFLFGTASLTEIERDTADNKIKVSAGYQKGGHFILRRQDLYVFIKAGEIGKHGKGAPGHNDTFTFEIYYKNKKFIVDSGTYSFYANSVLRNKLRSVKSHNTFFIDSEPLSEFDGLFKIKQDLTKPKILEWYTDETEDKLSAQHYAYTRLLDPVICKRTFYFLKNKNQLKISDEFFGGKIHQASVNLHFHPDVEVIKKSKYDFAAYNSGAEIEIKFFSSTEYFNCNVNAADYSERYGSITKSKKISINIKEQFPMVFITEIYFK